MSLANGQIEIALQRGQIDAFRQTQSREHPLAQVVLGRDALRGRLSGAGALDALHVPLRRAVVRIPEPSTALAQEPARAATRGSVLASAPVERVVDRLSSRSRVIADLVPRVSAFAELSADCVAHLGDDLVVRKRQLSAPQRLGHRHFFGEPVQRQGVAGDVLRAERHRGGGIPGGKLRRLPLGAVDEVQRDVAKPGCAGRLERAHCVGTAVPAPESDELRRRERLHADGQPVHAQLAEGGKPLLVGSPGIRLERHLRVGFDGPQRPDLPEHAPELRRVPQRRRAAAEIDGDGLPIRKLRRADAKLADHGIGVALLRDHRFGARREIAVRALRKTVREVDVDAELHQSSWNFARSVSRCAVATHSCSGGHAQTASQYALAAPETGIE